MIKIVFGNKYYFNSEFYRWEGLEENATKFVSVQRKHLKKQFPNDTYFVKVK